MNLLKDFIFFIKRPTYEFETSSPGFYNHFIRILNGFLFYFIAIAMSIIILGLLNYWNLKPDNTDKLTKAPLSIYLFIIAPLIEESIFRLPLRFSKFNISFSLTAIAVVLIHIYLKTSLILSLVISLPILLISFQLLSNSKIYNKLDLFWKTNFKLLFFLSVFLFGLIHIFNHKDLGLIHYLLAPLITIYQIILGLILGYYRVRFKYGFIYSVVLHILFNIPGILIIHSF
jgi:membrane protease YdiL (CAAX protease family)